MARKFKELVSKMPAESVAKKDEKKKKLREEMALNELRAARQMTQEHLASLLQVNQAAVSKIERRTDMYVSTLSGLIRAMGGQLEITARFPEGIVRIKQFGDVEASISEKPIAVSGKTTRGISR